MRCDALWSATASALGRYKLKKGWETKGSLKDWHDKTREQTPPEDVLKGDLGMAYECIRLSLDSEQIADTAEDRELDGSSLFSMELVNALRKFVVDVDREIAKEAPPTESSDRGVENSRVSAAGTEHLSNEGLRWEGASPANDQEERTTEAQPIMPTMRDAVGRPVKDEGSAPMLAVSEEAVEAKTTEGDDGDHGELNVILVEHRSLPR